MINSRFRLFTYQRSYFRFQIEKTISFNTCNYHFLLLLIYIFVRFTVLRLMFPIQSTNSLYSWEKPVVRLQFPHKLASCHVSAFSVRGGTLKFNVFTSVTHWTSVSRLIRRTEPSTYHSETDGEEMRGLWRMRARMSEPGTKIGTCWSLQPPTGLTGWLWNAFQWHIILFECSTVSFLWFRSSTTHV